jgi:DNA-binding protein YbaB
MFGWRNKMKDLIEALQIFLKYGNPDYPTHCEHDVMTVDINPELVSEEDKKVLDELGFFAENEEGCFKSFKFGSC